MFKYSFFIILSQLLCAQAVFNEWDFAVAATNKIIFYDSNWNVVTEEAHQFNSITAIAFNEIENEIFFNGKDRNNGSIHLLRLPTIKGSSSLIDTIVTRTDGDDIAAIAFDPLSQTLFWADETQRKISSLVLNGSINKPTELITFENERQKPYGLSLDMCRRKLYWSQSEGNDVYSINRMSLDGSNREKIIDRINAAYGIAVDQFTERIFITVNFESTQYALESFKLDGTDKQTLVNDFYHRPHGLTVTADSVIWLDVASKSAYKVPKTNESNSSTHNPVLLKKFSGTSYELVSKVGILHKYKSVAECKEVMEEIEESLASRVSKIPEEKTSAERNNSIMCLDHGFIGSNSECQCNPGYTGRRCQIYECYNFCVNGACKIENGFPKCTCESGYTGKHCETSACHNYCLNGGECNVYDGVATCNCKEGYKGARCEQNSTETCQAPCILPPKIDFNKNECNNICETVPKTTTAATTTIDPSAEKVEEMLQCPNAINKSIIVIVVGVIVSLGLVYLIIQALRRVYKPERPRIRKTFVVKQHKNSNTPLTSRPIAAEECQITIENCCNMNICETPCFDPKLLQETMSNDKKNGRTKKEDKEVLLPDLD